MGDEFVILRHCDYGPVHYDLMLQTGDALATWQMPVNPGELAVGEATDAKQLPDHRLAYLSYEVPVSRDRGRVERIEQGRYAMAVDEPTRRVVELSGQALTGSFELAEQADGAAGWRLTRIA